jgi:segregation and condensation protein A
MEKEQKEDLETMQQLESNAENLAIEDKISKKPNASHFQVYNIVTSKDPSWQGIIYDLISSEQLDPWDIDIAHLCKSYFEKIKQMEEANFFLSSKILLAASLLLRIKSEILLNHYIKEVDEILFGKKQEIDKVIERIEIDEGELPLLIPKSPLPRPKKVTVEELISALDTAIKTESRRINKEIEKKQTERLAYIDVPKHKRANIKDRIRQFYARVLTSFKNPKHKEKIKLPYTHFAGTDKEERIACFLPMLHLSNNKKLWLEQEEHFDEIYLYLLGTFKKHFPDHDKELTELEQELKQEIKEIDKELKDKHQQKVQEINKDFENPVGELISK